MQSCSVMRAYLRKIHKKTQCRSRRLEITEDLKQSLEEHHNIVYMRSEKVRESHVYKNDLRTLRDIICKKFKRANNTEL